MSGVRARAHEQLRELLLERSVRRGDFVLASGRRSSYYIDARLTTLSGAGQVLIGDAGLEALAEAGWRPDAVGGLTLGADPVACAIAHAAWAQGLAIEAFSVRREAKAHGTAKQIEGPLQAGMTVVIVEDVVTTGESAARAARAVEAIGCRVLGVVALVDREEGGARRLQEDGYTLRSLFTASELLSAG